MGRASSGKKVARAAQTGGGRTSATKRPWGWYSAIVMVIALGIVLIVTSREDRSRRLITASPKVGEHWHAAYGFYVCGSFLAPLTNERDPKGIHTHAPDGVGDGVIHVHPFTSAAAGKKATLGVFADAAGFTLEPGKLEVPGDKERKDGDTCDGKKATLQIERDGKLVKGDPRKVRIMKDRSLITIAFVPVGTDIPEPLSKPNLDQLSDVGPTPGGPTQEVPISIPNDPNAPPATPAPGEPGASVPPEGTPPPGEPESSTPPSSAAPPPTSSP